MNRTPLQSPPCPPPTSTPRFAPSSTRYLQAPRATGPRSAGLGPDGATSGSLALDVDAEARAVVGYCYSDTGDAGAVWFLDSALHSPGPHHVSTLLSSAGIWDHAGWSLDLVTGVTIDPNRVLVLIGAGANPAHQSEGWIARVPPWCLTPRPPKFVPNKPYYWPEPWHTIPGGPIDPLRGPKK